MNSPLIHSVLRRHAARVLAIAAAATIAVGGATASAQTGLVGTLGAGQPTPSEATAGYPAGAAAMFTPGTKILSASDVPTAADVRPGRLAPGSIAHAVGGDFASADSAGVAQVGYACQSCMQHSCNGACGGYGMSGYGGQSMACGVPCDPYYYVIVEAMYMERNGEDGFSLTQNERMDDFGFEWMPRITFGTLPNCVNGYEFTFTGPTEWNRSLRVVDTNSPGNIDSFLFDGDGPPTTANPHPQNFDGSFLDPFQDANLQTQFYNTEYWSAELNKTIVGWDVAKVLFGGRLIRVEEDFGYASQKDIFASSADLTAGTENTMVGLQLGLDLLNPLTQNLYTDLRARIGVHYNFADSEIRLRNQGTTVLSTSRDDDDFCGVFDVGLALRYQLGEILSIRGGGEVLYITNTALVPGQIDAAVTNALGSRIDMNDGLLFYGGTFGIELRY
ncbi:hypothetical protein Mal15_16290 [Stieleria maiorica]|uniref:Uncharacterized protein n=1 Tax=Stieleria maiorica TaxID=2795974 RepID=A0A5B9M8V4_9BACT|nr:hypothetical protein [Stieleria maiorica]QEF97588.1 hypothetical protein Mal15_16290 [Stieleria maiorica]